MRNRTAMPATAFAVILLAMLTALSTPSRAQPISGIYVGAGAGLHAPEDPGATPSTSSFGTGLINLDEGFGFNSNLAIGYAIGNGFRFELEGDFMRSDLRQISSTPFPTTSSGGHVKTWGAMANAVFDMDIGSPYIFPYLGGGAGYQWTALNNVNAVQVGGPFSFATNSITGTFAMQVIVGASFPIPNMPGLSLTLDYRFMDILGGEKFDGTEVVTAGGPAMNSSLKLHNQYNHDAVLGVRYAFNVPPPPVPVAPAPVGSPAPAPARSYLVFFDWDKANLTERARAIVKEAADNSTRVQYHPYRGQRLYRHFRHSEVPIRVYRYDAPRPLPRNWCVTACRRVPSISAGLVTPTFWWRPPGACGSRKTAASRSSCSDPGAHGAIASPFSAPPGRRKSTAVWVRSWII